MSEVRVPWADGDVTAILEDRGSAVGVLLAHGAGAGQEHPFMTAMRRDLAASGFTTMTFDYAYKEAGRRAPDRLPRLLAVHEAALTRLLTEVDRVVLAGKSMGARVGSHLVGGVDAAPGRAGDEVVALVHLGYPLVAIGKSEPRPVDQLHTIHSSQLFVSGSRDRLAPLDLLGPVVHSLPEAELYVIDDADHGFHVPKRTGRTDDEVVSEVVDVVVRFLGDQASGGT